MMRWKAHPIIKEVDEYFAADLLDGVNPETLALAKKLKVLDCSVFERFWLRLEGKEFDYSGCKFVDNEFKSGAKGKVMRNK